MYSPQFRLDIAVGLDGSIATAGPYANNDSARVVGKIVRKYTLSHNTI